MSSELLFRKLQRLKGLSIDLRQYNQELSSLVDKAFVLLSDPSTHLDLVPREQILEEVIIVKRQMSSTSNINRDFLETMIQADIKDDKELIKKKMRNLKVTNSENLIYVSSCLKIIRKIMSAMTSELPIGGQNG